MALKKPSEILKSNLTEDYNPLVASIGKFSEENTNKNNSSIFESFNSFKGNFDKIDILSEKIEGFYEEISERITKKDFENAMLSQLMVIDESFSQIKSQIKGINKKDLFEFKETVRNIETIISNLIENDIPSYRKIITNNEISYDTKIQNFQNKISTEVEEYYKIISELIVNINEKITDSVDETVNERIENYLRKHHSQVVDLKEEVLSKIDELPIGDFENNLRDLERKIRHIERVYGSINTDALVENVVKEGLLNEPPDVKNSDPLTPLDQNFVTQQELQTHYKLFLNRIQQQMATIGGGGETRLKYLDDIVGIATNASAYDNKFLKYNHSIGKFEFVTVSGGGGGTGESFWSPGVVGIVTTSNVGIATNNPTSTLTVAGDIEAINANFIGSIDQLSSPVVNIPSEIDATNRNYGILGVGTTIGFLDTGILAHFSGDSDQYCQVIVQNHNPGSDASADFIVNNSQELGLNHYVDLGINSPNYVGADDLSDPNGGYVYNTGGTLTVGTADPFDLKFVYESSEVARVSQNGIGIGTTVVTSALTLIGDALIDGVVTATDFNSASDIKLKENVSVIDNPLDKIVKLEGVNFQWKETGKKSLGVIAQEVEKVLPELVSGEETKTVNYNGIIGLLIECVKEQQKEIDELKKLIDK